MLLFEASASPAEVAIVRILVEKPVAAASKSSIRTKLLQNLHEVTALRTRTCILCFQALNFHHYTKQ